MQTSSAATNGAGTGGATSASSATTTAATSSTAASGGDGGSTTAMDCNPFTNEPCAAGDACDIAMDGNFYCFPGNNTVDQCGDCNPQGGPYCKFGMSCQLAVEGTGNNECTKFCCEDADCGPGGLCDLQILADSHNVGLCTDDTDASLPGPICMAPDAPPSMGSCFKP